MQPQELMFPAGDDPGQVFAALSSRFTVHAEPARRSHWTCLDTADWRLHRARMTLRDLRRGRTGELVLSTDRGERTTASSPSSAWPRLLDALPPSGVRDRILATVGVRALLPLAEVDVHSIPLRVLDDEEKTRVRVRVDQLSLSGERHRALPLRVLISSLRGYERDAHRCAAMLSDSLGRLAGTDAATTIAMTAAGNPPGLSPLPAVQMDPDAPAAESLVRVLRRWMAVIDLARPGVLHDVDPEYLHDLRGASRAMRSVLSLGADLLPTGQTAHFAAEFAWLGQLTTPVRDLDFQLLDLSGRGSVDLAGLDDLDSLRQLLVGRRSRAVRAVRAGLQSPRGRNLSRHWIDMLDSLAAPELAGPTTAQAAAAQAQISYQRILNAAVGVDAHTPADDLHGLRRRCKRMRYLLQSYESVYARPPYRAVLGKLKRLQDSLGEIRDSHVQHDELAAAAATLTRHGASTQTLLAVGALRDRGRARDANARQDLPVQLERFRAHSTHAQVQALTAGPS